jgi:putative membrane protein
MPYGGEPARGIEQTLSRLPFDVSLRPMPTDLVLAILHHLAIVALIVLIAIEFALLRPGLTQTQLRLLTRVDMAYGVTAGLVIAAGVGRVVWGIKGADFYLSNPWFWAKMASFAAIGLLSVPPTLRLLAWRKQARVNAAFLPPTAEIAGLRRFVHAEVGLLALVVGFAAAMARYGAF